MKNASEKAGKMPIYARITINGKRIELSARNLIDFLIGTKNVGLQNQLMIVLTIELGNGINARPKSDCASGLARSINAWPLRDRNIAVVIMSHIINYNEQTGKHSFFSVKEKTWHGLGQIVKDYPTSAEALKFAGLDNLVEKQKLYTQRNEYENLQISVPDYYATLRSDTNQVLGVVGKDYEVKQNTEPFNFFDSMVGGDGIQYETAGALGNGERIFITAKLPSFIKIGRDD